MIKPKQIWNRLRQIEIYKNLTVLVSIKTAILILLC